jgi:hypothetical protein
MATLFYRDPNDGQFYPVVGGGNDHGELFGLADDDHPQYARKDAKGVANGYASLDANTKVPYAQLPTGTNTWEVASGAHEHSALGYRKIWASPSAPLAGDGADGDVWMVYV